MHQIVCTFFTFYYDTPGTPLVLLPRTGPPHSKILAVHLAYHMICRQLLPIPPTHTHTQTHTHTARTHMPRVRVCTTTHQARGLKMDAANWAKIQSCLQLKQSGSYMTGEHLPFIPCGQTVTSWT